MIVVNVQLQYRNSEHVSQPGFNANYTMILYTSGFSVGELACTVTLHYLPCIFPRNEPGRSAIIIIARSLKILPDTKLQPYVLFHVFLTYYVGKSKNRVLIAIIVSGSLLRGFFSCLPTHECQPL